MTPASDQDASQEGRRAGHSRLFVKEGKIVKEGTGQDAVQRAKSLVFHWPGEPMTSDQDKRDLVRMIAHEIDAAVAEAVRKSETRGDRREAEMAEQRDLAYVDGDRRVAAAVKERDAEIAALKIVLHESGRLRAEADLKLAQARREERERIAQVWRHFEARVDADDQWVLVGRYEMNAVLGGPPASAPEGTNQ